MASYPQTYQIVRQGVATPVMVADDADVLALRTELELMASFAQGAAPDLAEALEDRLAAVKSGEVGEGGRTVEELADMIAILRDAIHPSTGEAIVRIDADFPRARGEIDMAAVEKESNEFHKDVGDEVAASGRPDASRMSQAFKQAMLNKAVATRQAVQEAGDASQRAAAENTTADGSAPKQQPTVTAMADDQKPLAELTPETMASDPVEAALKEAIGMAEQAVASDGADALEAGDEPDDEGLSIEELEAAGISQVGAIDESGRLTEGDGLAETVELPEAGPEGRQGQMTAEPLEQIMAEQAGLPDSEMPLDQLADKLLAGQTDSLPPTSQAVEAATGTERIRAQMLDASQSIPEAGGVEQIVDHAGELVEKNQADVSQNNARVSPDDAGCPDMAGEEVAHVIEAGRNEIDDIAAAFQEATEDLETLAGEVSDCAFPPDTSLFTEAEPDGTSDARHPAEETGIPMNEVGEIGGDPNAPAVDGSSAFQAFNLPSLNMREELHAVRQTIQSSLESLIQLLDRIDQTHIEAENRLGQARSFQQAAQRAQEASEKLVQARTEAADAKAAFESAQRRLEEAESVWKEARRAADDAAL